MNKQHLGKAEPKKCPSPWQTADVLGRGRAVTANLLLLTHKGRATLAWDASLSWCDEEQGEAAQVLLVNFIFVAKSQFHWKIRGQKLGGETSLCLGAQPGRMFWVRSRRG